MARIIKSQENPEGKQSNKAVLCFVAGMIIQTEVQSKNHAFLNAGGNEWMSTLPLSYHRATAIRREFAFNARDESVKTHSVKQQQVIFTARHCSCWLALPQLAGDLGTTA